MLLILVFAVVAFATGGAALMMTIRDFKYGTTFTPLTAVTVYAGWSTHAGAFVAALLLDPYRVHSGVVLAAIFGVVLACGGIALFVLGVTRFQSFGHVTGTETGNLVTSGAYRYSRNPQYTGWIVLLIGAAVAGRSPIALGLAVAVVVAMRIWIPHEEKHLEAEFDDDYRRYRDRVARFVTLSRVTRQEI